MNDMLAFDDCISCTYCCILIGHSIYTSRRLKLVEERLQRLEADERRGKKRTNEEPAQLNSIANNVDSKEE